MAREVQLQVIGAVKDESVVFSSAVPGVSINKFEKSASNALKANAEIICRACMACRQIGNVAQSGEVVINGGGGVPPELVTNGTCRLVGATLFVSTKNLSLAE